MEERRRIIIQTGAEPEGSLQSPHFDAEATLMARRVVPISEQETAHMHYAPYGQAPARPFWKRPAVLALVVLFAIGVGVAAGIGIGYYRNRKSAQAPVTERQAAPVENTGTVQEPPASTVPSPEQSPQVGASVPVSPSPVPAEPKEDERENSARNEPREERDEDSDEAAPPASGRARRDKSEDDDEAVLDERQAEKQRRKEERRERRRREREDEVDIPRQIERAGRELDRIRDIFEGKQP